MSDLQELQKAIESALLEKAYNLPVVCVKLGLAGGDYDEAYYSRKGYVVRRLMGKSQEETVKIARQILEQYPPSSSRLQELLRSF